MSHQAVPSPPSPNLGHRRDTSSWATPLESVLIGLGVFLFGALSDVLLHRHAASLLIAVLADTIIAIGAGALGFLYISARREKESTLHENEQRLRAVLDATPFPVAVVDVDDDNIIYWSRSAFTLFGHTAPRAREWYQIAYPDPDYQQEVIGRWKPALELARRSPKAVNAGEYRVTCRDGSQRICEIYAAFISNNLIVTFNDITERKRAEDAVQESEKRFRVVANTAPVMIWMSGTDKLCDYFNQSWLDFTGRSQAEELGNGWADGVHPEDLERCLETYGSAFGLREPFEMEYRLRRHDGQYRWILDRGIARFNADGSFAGYIGSCIDVTERKLAEESIATIGRRLIEAHEEERTWIGRELHDDINQRLALVAVELDQSVQHLLSSAPGLRDELHHAQQRIVEIARDVQALSHRLHSSKLDYLGLVAAANSFCKELADQKKVRIDFTHDDIPPTLPKETSLCLFRVLQEALQNAVKHSGVQLFKVELRATPSRIEIIVHDDGVGFDTKSALAHHGLGLISMQERLQLVGGELSVRSEPGYGTIVRARIPFREEQHRIERTA